MKKYPILFTGVVSIAIPIVNICLLLVDDESEMLGPKMNMTRTGIFVLSATILLPFITLFIYSWSRLFTKIIVALIFSGITILFFLIKTDSYVIQIVILFLSLFVILYTFLYKSVDDTRNKQFVKVMVIHLFLIVLLLYIIEREGLYSNPWINISVLIHILLLLIYLALIWVWVFKHKRKYNSFLFIILEIVLYVLLLFFPYIGIPIVLIVFSYLIWRSFNYLGYSKDLINLLFDKPFKLLISSFALIILLGSILLSLKVSSATGVNLSYIDSLFTATSATCVTGLIVLDTPNDFTFFGQFLILLLIQIGGLGIVTITTFAGLILGRSIGLKRQYTISEIVGSMRPRFVFSIIRFIILVTLIAETMGAILLTIGFYKSDISLAESVWKGVFHSTSAFCNAGFALQTNSLIDYNSTIIIPLVISFLVIIGGLGFGVLSSSSDYIFKRKFRLKNIPLVAKISLSATVILLVSGYLIFLLGEYNNTFNQLSPSFRHVNAFFQSVTARTAGFNTIDTAELSNSSIVALWVLMFIGGGSCSTAGGIKVTTIGVLFAIIYTNLKGKKNTTIFGREIPNEIISTSIVLVTVSFVLIIIAVLLLLNINSQLTLNETVFEVISAFGTVGLSMGATEKLGSFGKFIIILLMYIGRVGPMSFLALITMKSIGKSNYPEENIIIG